MATKSLARETLRHIVGGASGLAVGAIVADWKPQPFGLEIPPAFVVGLFTFIGLTSPTSLGEMVLAPIGLAWAWLRYLLGVDAEAKLRHVLRRGWATGSADKEEPPAAQRAQIVELMEALKASLARKVEEERKQRGDD